MAGMLGSLMQLFARPKPRRAPPSVQRQSLQDFLDELNASGGSRVTTIRLLGERSAHRGVLFQREHLEFEDADGNARQADVYLGHYCTTGHLLDQQVRAVSLCALCGAIMCSTPGCAATCSVCGESCCPVHRSTYDLGNGKTVTYCSRCSWRHFWKLWWGLYK